MRSLSVVLCVSVVALVSGVAVAADGGPDAGDDASADASLDAESDASPDGAGDATVADASDASALSDAAASDVGVVTYRPDTGNVTDDAGTSAPASGGCTCELAGAPDAGSSRFGGAWPACALGALALAGAGARRRRRRH
ncbi:MAG TPA: hypothetical protein VLM85_22505 [Polyangiaceae bacterium]|nr:hypothetical protein [Polyangiaceae bacterium]